MNQKCLNTNKVGKMALNWSGKVDINNLLRHSVNIIKALAPT